MTGAGRRTVDLREVGIVSFAQARNVAHTADTAVELILPVIDAARRAAGVERSEIDFWCHGSCDYMVGQPFSFVAAVDAIGAWPPIVESHVEMDGAWALYEAWIKIQTGEADVALVFGNGKTSSSDIDRTLALQLDPYVVAPMWPDQISIGALQARACLEAGVVSERAMAAVASRSLRDAMTNPNALRRGDHSIEELLARPRTHDPLREHDGPPVTDGASAMVIAVVGAALHGAPPALTGLGALLALLASLSRVQTAAVCIGLVAMPVGLQLNERHAADEGLKRTHAQLLAAQNEGAPVQADVERLRADSAKLEQSLAQANEAVARAAADAQAFADWKQKIRAALMAADYRWSDESPFVRIPKVILPELSGLIQAPAFSPPGVVNPYERELLGLTPAERQTIEEMLQRVAELQRGEKADVYEIENRVSGRTVASKLFADEPPGKVGPEAEQRFAQMLTDLRDILGEERWPVVPSR